MEKINYAFDTHLTEYTWKTCLSVCSHDNLSNHCDKSLILLIPIREFLESETHVNNAFNATATPDLKVLSNDIRNVENVDISNWIITHTFNELQCWFSKSSEILSVYTCIPNEKRICHYNDVIMSAMASQITSIPIVCWTVYSRCRSKKTVTPMLHLTGLCAWNSPGTGDFPAQMASNAEDVSIWWRHHAKNMIIT